MQSYQGRLLSQVTELMMGQVRLDLAILMALQLKSKGWLEKQLKSKGWLEKQLKSKG